MGPTPSSFFLFNLIMAKSFKCLTLMSPLVYTLQNPSKNSDKITQTKTKLCVTCHVSTVPCHESPATCHLPPVTCHLSPGFHCLLSNHGWLRLLRRKKTFCEAAGEGFGDRWSKKNQNKSSKNFFFVISHLSNLRSTPGHTDIATYRINRPRGGYGVQSANFIKVRTLLLRYMGLTPDLSSSRIFLNLFWGPLLVFLLAGLHGCWEPSPWQVGAIHIWCQPKMGGSRSPSPSKNHILSHSN